MKINQHSFSYTKEKLSLMEESAKGYEHLTFEYPLNNTQHKTYKKLEDLGEKLRRIKERKEWIRIRYIILGSDNETMKYYDIKEGIIDNFSIYETPSGKILVVDFDNSLPFSTAEIPIGEDLSKRDTYVVTITYIPKQQFKPISLEQAISLIGINSIVHILQEENDDLKLLYSDKARAIEDALLIGDLNHLRNKKAKRIWPSLESEQTDMTEITVSHIQNILIE